ncbi:MAG: hypothetical protein WCH39_24610 [Schlesneria sp.]
MSTVNADKRSDEWRDNHNTAEEAMSTVIFTNASDGKIILKGKNVTIPPDDNKGAVASITAGENSTGYKHTPDGNTAKIPGTRFDRFDVHKSLQIEIIRCLALANDSLTKIEICDRLGRNRSSTPVGGLMRLLAAQGYINGKRASDGKTLQYSLTATGTELAVHPERVGLGQKEKLLPVEW